MAINKRTLNKLGLTLWLATAIVLPNVSSAAPGTLASVPLFTQGNVDPNIQFHLDSSGSMNHVMVESSYSGTPTFDSSVKYDADPDTILTDACAGGLIPAGSTVYLRMSGTTPKIRYNDGTVTADYDLGNDAGEKCFDPDQDYNARLTTYPTLPITLTYSGNYLNWYFNPGTTSGTWSSWDAATTSATGQTNYKKPQTRSRMDVAQESLTSLINSLNSVRIGASKFRISSSPANYGLGADFVEPIGDIDSGTKRSDVVTAINDMYGHGGTPLAEALKDIGRYFSNDGSANCGGGSNLTLHPGTTNDVESCTNVLGNAGPAASLAGPIQYSCQANFVIYTTDGLSSHDIGQNSGSYDLIENTPLADYDGDCTAADVTAGTCTGVYDKKAGTTYTTHAEASDYLDDVAQALYEVDLRPDLDDVDGNEVTNNIRTYVVGFADEDVRDNQLLKDTADQGGGEFIFAEDSNELTSAFEDATSSILDLIGSAAAVTFNSATLGTDSSVYLALFNSSSWSGDLLSYDLNDNNGDIEAQQWSAATELDALSDADAVNDRVMLTYNGTKGVPFRWPSDYQNPDTSAATGTDMSTVQLEDLLTNADYAFGTANAAEKTANETFGQQVVDFIRGDTSLEGSVFRNRTSRLGDIIHAGPVYVGPPELNWPDGNGSNGFPETTEAYSQYKLKDRADGGQANRNGVVYVGSNDGFLHGFATDDVSGQWSAGEEVLAYAPKVLFSTASTRGYHYLTESGYNHQYYVDALPTVSDVYIDSEWKTVLVGGLRGGGRGIYALNVTNPQNFSEANASDIVMGEFTNNDDADLGYTFGTPTIALMQTASNTYRWAIIMGNGYNPDTTITDAAGNTATGEASLFIIYLDPDLSDGWTLGDDYIKISTGIGTTADLNGLSTPSVVDLDGDYIVDRIYAGDLKGNMWAFDVSANNDSNWASAYKQGSTPKPLFIAGSTKPITAQPEVVFNPNIDSGNAPNTLVLFGTGQYMASGDNANLGDQSFYGVWDHGTGELTPGDLIEQELSESGSTRTITNADVNYAGGDDGWFINFDLNSDGERMVTNPVVRGDIVYFNTSIPSNATCSYGGTGWQMSIDYSEGHNPDPAVVDTNGDGVVNASDTATAGGEFEQGLPAAPSFLSNRRYTPGTRTQAGSEVVQDAVEDLGGGSTGRLSWEELTSSN